MIVTCIKCGLDSSQTGGVNDICSHIFGGGFKVSEELKPCPFCGKNEALGNPTEIDFECDCVKTDADGTFIWVDTYTWQNAYCWKEIDRLKKERDFYRNELVNWCGTSYVEGKEKAGKFLASTKPVK